MNEEEKKDFLNTKDLLSNNNINIFNAMESLKDNLGVEQLINNMLEYNSNDDNIRLFNYIIKEYDINIYDFFNIIEKEE